jgi:hypothetical protein
MKYTAILDKMRVEYTDPVSYYLSTDQGLLPMNAIIGKRLEIEYTGEIICVRCNRKTNKSFGQGYCYPCFISAPETEECVLRPELCKAHLGIARDITYARTHCLSDHFVYLAASPEIKVGVTRSSQIPVRWIDQGASFAIKIAKTINRYQAGLIEVELKKHIPDKTNWRKMLNYTITEVPDFNKTLTKIKLVLSQELQNYLLSDERHVEIKYPVLSYPVKAKPVNLEKILTFSGILKGIKGQYLMMENDDVINIRSHTGYRVNISAD